MERSGYVDLISWQMRMAEAFRHAGTCRIDVDKDPLAEVWRDLLRLLVRGLRPAVRPASGTDGVRAPRGLRRPLLLCRYRAMLLEYGKHGFSFERFRTADAGKAKQSVQDLFVGALAYPFEHGGARRKRGDRKSLRRVLAYELPEGEEGSRFGYGDFAVDREFTRDAGEAIREAVKGCVEYFWNHDWRENAVA